MGANAHYLVAMIGRLRASLRLLLFPTVTLFCAIATLLLRLFGLPHTIVYRVFLFWKAAMRFILNIHIVHEGPVPVGAAIIMANHRSYLDVVMIPSKTAVVFVAKASVRKWPIVGWGGDGMKTIWVDRSDPESRKNTRRRIMERLSQGLSVIIFPEGTTHVGPDVLAFKPGMFHVVAGTSVPIVPVAIEYRNANMAWVGQDRFVPHFLREFGARRTEVKVGFGTPITHHDGTVLCDEVHGWIAAKAADYRRDWDRSDAREPARN